MKCLDGGPVHSGCTKSLVAAGRSVVGRIECHQLLQFIATSSGVQSHWSVPIRHRNCRNRGGLIDPVASNHTWAVTRQTMAW